MNITFFNNYDEAIAFTSSASFYVAVVFGLISLATAMLAIGLYGKRANKVGFGKLLRKMATLFIELSFLMAIPPIIYVFECTLIFRSLIENCYIILTKVFTM